MESVWNFAQSNAAIYHHALCHKSKRRYTWEISCGRTNFMRRELRMNYGGISEYYNSPLDPSGLHPSPMIDTLRSRQTGRHFTGWQIFKCIFFNDNVRISIQISLTNGANYNEPALIQIMARRRTGDKPLTESVMSWFTDRHIGIYAPLGPDGR